MTPGQITDIAREYAEFTDLSPADQKIISVVSENFLQYIMYRYCLVEKAKLIEEYKSAKQDNKMAHREKLYSMLAVAEARKALLEPLFPEIAKEVEE